MAERLTDAGVRAERQEAANEQAAAIAEKGGAVLNAVFSGGQSAAKIDSETAHRISAQIARDVDAGRPIRPTADYVREARRR